MSILLYEHAKEKINAPPGWEVYRYHALGRGNDFFGFELTGAVAPLNTRGPYKGKPNWKRMDKTTQKTVYFTPQEHEEWCKAWEQKTGKCAECVGKGEVIKSWSRDVGEVMKTCVCCSGTGKKYDTRQ